MVTKRKAKRRVVKKKAGAAEEKRLAAAKKIGVDVKFLKPEQVKEIWPLCHTDDLVGAIQHPEDGYIQPADLTQALATGARNRGAEIYRNTTVLSMRQTKDGWVVETDKGTIECEHVISCSGNFARQDLPGCLSSSSYFGRGEGAFGHRGHQQEYFQRGIGHGLFGPWGNKRLDPRAGVKNRRHPQLDKL